MNKLINDDEMFIKTYYLFLELEEYQRAEELAKELIERRLEKYLKDNK